MTRHLGILLLVAAATPLAWGWEIARTPPPPPLNQTSPEALPPGAFNGVQREVGDPRLNQKEVTAKKQHFSEANAENAISQNVPGGPGAAALVTVVKEAESEKSRPIKTAGVGVLVFSVGLLSVLALRWWADKAGPQPPARRTLRW